MAHPLQGTDEFPPVPDAPASPAPAAIQDDPRPQGDGLRWSLWLLVVLACLGTVAPFLVHAGLYLAYPFSLDETEGYLLGQVARLAEGGRLYGPIDEPPYVVDNYPPGFLVLTAAVERVVGAERHLPAVLPTPDLPDDDPQSIGVRAATLAHNFAIPRTLAALFLLTALISMAVTWRRDRAGWGSIALAVVLLLAQPPIFFMFPLGRADWGALGLGILAVGMAFRGLDRNNPKATPWLWYALVPAVLALLFRQSAVAPLVAITLSLWYARDPRLKAWVLAALAGVGLLLVTLHLVYGPGIWLHTVTYTKTRFLLPRLWSTWAFLLQHSALFLVLTLLAWLTVRRSCITFPTILPLVYAPLALLTMALSGKVGSDMNYFLEGLLASGWLIGFALPRWLKPAEDAVAAAPPPGWLGVALLLVLLQSAYLQNPRVGSYRPTRFDVANGVELLTQLQQVEGTVVSEEEGILALAGKPVYFNPFIMSELARLGLWDQTPVVSLLEQGQAPVVILRELPNPDRARDSGTGAGWNRFTPEMERALANRYRPLLVVPFRREWIVMVPR